MEVIIQLVLSKMALMTAEQEVSRVNKEELS